MAYKNKMEEIRAEIDALDEDIASLILKRMDLVAEVAKHKRELDLPIMNKEREEEVIKKALAKIEDADKARYLKHIYETLLTESKRYQEKLATKSPRIMVINGPNLNKLGTREPEVYGYETYEDLIYYLEAKAAKLGFEIECYQSNIEGELITKIQEAAEFDALIINPAGYSHTSIAILDALLSIEIPIVEVHLSNIHKRDEFRDRSLSARRANAVVVGMGFESYGMGLEYLDSILKRYN